MPLGSHSAGGSDWPVVWAGGDGGGDGASRTNENARFDETGASITNQNARFTVTENKQHPISNDVASTSPHPHPLWEIAVKDAFASLRGKLNLSEIVKRTD